MSKADKKLINLNRNEFTDRRIEENVKFSELTIRLATIDTVLLLLESAEEMVLINALKHIVEYVRKNDESIALLKEKHVLQLLLHKEFYRAHSSILVKRLSLYLASFIIENINCLVELETFEICEIVNLGLSCYLEEDDDFCCEYLSVVINKCMDDPQCVELVLKDSPFVLKCFSTIATSTNPDVLLHSFQLLHKLLLLQSGEEKHNFTTLASFPIKRLMCELNCEYFEIRQAALKVIQSLVVDPGENNILNQNPWAASLMEQLTKIFCQSALADELGLVVKVLATAMEDELLLSLFFELNLFDKYLTRLNDGTLQPETICTALWVFSECAKCIKFLERLVSANITEKMLDCLLDGDHNPPAHILLGLNRLMKSPAASKRIIDAFDRGLLNKTLQLLSLKETNIKAREQAANLLENLLSYAFHKTANEILVLNLPNILANILAQDPAERSIDLILSLLNVIEMLAANTDYRSKICANKKLMSNMGLLLKNSFPTAILVTNLIRCLSCLVNEEEVHEQLLNCFLCSSIKRALQSPSNQVKAAVTNFIMQTTRFPQFVNSYKQSGVLDVLLLGQKHAFCVPTWKPAIDSILAKSLTMKFCIGNSLGFSDITCILKEEVSPLHPVIVVNFNRRQTPEHLVVKVASIYCDEPSKGRSNVEEWCYCRSPGDEFLPQYLEEVNAILKSENLTVNPVRSQKSIDFDNLAKRAKVIAQVVERALSTNLPLFDLNASEECSNQTVKCHLRELCMELHCSFIPLGRIRSGCKFERAILFKALADQVGLPCTLQRSVDGRSLYNEIPLPVELDEDVHCDKKSLAFLPWRMLRPTHIVDLMYNVGDLYPLQSRQAFQYLRLY